MSVIKAIFYDLWNGSGSYEKSIKEANSKDITFNKNINPTHELEKATQEISSKENLVNEVSEQVFPYNNKIADFLKEHDYASINSKNPSGFTPLHTAISTNNLEMVQALLKNNAEVNAVAYLNITPLKLAVNGYICDGEFYYDDEDEDYTSNDAIVKELLKYKADPNIKSDYDGESTFDTVKFSNHPHAIELSKELIKAGADYKDLIENPTRTSNELYKFAQSFDAQKFAVDYHNNAAEIYNDSQVSDIDVNGISSVVEQQAEIVHL